MNNNNYYFILTNEFIFNYNHIQLFTQQRVCDDHIVQQYIDQIHKNDTINYINNFYYFFYDYACLKQSHK
jgi:hypothetical protein